MEKQIEIKKEVIQKRLEAQLERIQKKRAEHEALFPEYKKQYLEVDRRNTEEIKKATTWAEWEKSGNQPLPNKPYLSGFDLDEREKLVRRNLLILQAINGNTIPVQAIKTGRGLTLETIFDDVL